MLSAPSYTPTGMSFRTAIVGGNKNQLNKIIKPAYVIVCIHGNGFCAQTFEAMLHDKQFMDYPAPLFIVAPDLRGHGESAKGMPGPFRSLRENGDDILTLLDYLVSSSIISKKTKIALVGHSSGSTALLWAMSRTKDQSRFKFALLIEPIVSPREEKPGKQGTLYEQHPFVVKTAKRRSEFPSKKQALESFLDKGIFKGWAPLALAGYVEGALTNKTLTTKKSSSKDVVLTEQPVVLCCLPEWESRNFVYKDIDREIWSNLGDKIRVPLVVIRGNDSYHTLRHVLVDLTNSLPSRLCPLIERPGADHCPQCHLQHIPFLVKELLDHLEIPGVSVIGSGSSSSSSKL
jgi:pimeloyl-ACP methyl ester carboxylesterase